MNAVIRGTKALIITHCVIAELLLLYASQLPQYGDGAIGTIIVLAVSLAAYVLMLALAVPMAIRALRRGETIAQSAWLCAAIAVPLASWLIMIWWVSL